MEIEKKIRTQARGALVGKWSTAVAGLFVVFGVISIAACLLFAGVSGFDVYNEDDVLRQGSEPILCAVIGVVFLWLVIMSPIKNGFYRLCFNITNGRPAELSDIFYYFRNGYFRTLGFNLRIFIRKLLGALFCFSLYILNLFTFQNVILESLYFGIGVTATAIWFVRLLPSQFVFIEFCGMRVSDVLRLGSRLGSEHLKDYLLLVFSYIPWVLLCFLVLPALYVIPYMNTALATTSKWLINIFKEGNRI